MNLLTKAKDLDLKSNAQKFIIYRNDRHQTNIKIIVQLEKITGSRQSQLCRDR